MARYVLRARKFLAKKVLHTDDSPHTIALGTGIAMFVTFLPLIGLQTVIAIGIAALLRANKAVCIPIVWITNVFTAVPIYGACLGLGRFVLAGSAADESAALATLAQEPKAGFLELAFWKEMLFHLASLGKELWIGCLIVGTVTAVASYFLARRGVSAYRERRRLRILRRNLQRSNLARQKLVRRSEPAQS